MLPDPPQTEIVWGVFTRLLGVVYLVALAPLWWQVVPFAGERGCVPLAPLLARIRLDFPSWHARLRYFPTLFWLSSSPAMLRGVVVLGCVAAIGVVYGGPWSPLALAVCFVALLSLRPAMYLFYPWDSLLLEAGFLAILLPPLLPLPALAAAQAPAPLLAFALHLLLVRVLVGFGKYKFVGHARTDDLYVREFLVHTVPPTRSGWYAHHLPPAFHRLALYGMAAAELLLPPLALLPGPPRVVALASTAALMLAIWLTGNYGYFNLLVLVLCVPLLDLHSSIAQVRLEQVLGSPGDALRHAVLLVLLVGAVIHFPFNSWCDATWLHWPSLLGVGNRALRALLAFYRGLVPFGVVHAYGVFPAHSVPPLRFVPVLEGSMDGVEWREYGYRYWPSTERSAPPAFAPFHPRLDHMLLYEGLGMTLSYGFLASAIGPGMPYDFARTPWLAQVMRGLTQADSPVRSLLGADPFHGQPPRYARCSLYALRPVSLAEHRRTGRWWHRHRLGLHLPAITAEEAARPTPLAGPELFHWDAVFWRRRTPAFRRFERAARAATTFEALEAAVAATLDLPETTVQRFWGEFVPAIRFQEHGRWDEIADLARACRERFGEDALRDFERIASLLALGVAARLEDCVHGLGGARRLPWPVLSYFHAGMLFYALIAHGREEFAPSFADQEYVVTQARRLSNAAGLWLFGIFRPEALAFEARAARLVEQFAPLRWAPGLPGFSAVMGFLAQHLHDPDGERRLVLTRRVPDGAWEAHWPEADEPGAVAGSGA